MIRCQRHHLEARCRERGYTLDEVSECIVSESDGMIMVDETHPKYPHPRPGLGDMIASTLDAAGITKQRVQALASRVGIKDCGCSKRQKAANELGRKYLGIGRVDPPT